MRLVTQITTADVAINANELTVAENYASASEARSSMATTEEQINGGGQLLCARIYMLVLNS